MELPVHHFSDDDSGVLAHHLERWPDFVQPASQLPEDVRPLAEVEETDDSYLVDVELPGVRPPDVQLHLERNRLLVTAVRPERKQLGAVRHLSRTPGRFALTVTLPSAVDPAGVSARLEHGLLTVVVPKAERARRRHIPVTRRT